VSQNTFVPDDNFEQALIDLGFDSPPLDDFVPTANINGVTNLDVPNKNISVLTGIEDFTALTQLDCSGNLLTNIDVSQNTALKILWCFFNRLTTLDVSKNTQLISLVCNDNLITTLDVTKNNFLTVLVFKNNNISIIDLSKNNDLIRLECGNNGLSNLDVSKNINLSILACDTNQISNLDLLSNRNLTNLFCGFNQLSELDLTNNPSLVNINASNNNLCRLNIINGNNSNIATFNARNNPNLSCIFVDNVSYSNTNWPNVDANSNFVTMQAECDAFDNSTPVDTLNDFIGTSYTLPLINNGTYFTQSGGHGTRLNTGDIITTSQTVYIYNETVCYSNESNFNVIISNGSYFIPKYFTPNNDGYHDYWQVLDTANAIRAINIYNRYGKLLKSLPANSDGWNGTFRGHLLESDDYWYAITLNSGEILKGHFALKR
jgi:gliding motility-associated-like protein